MTTTGSTMRRMQRLGRAFSLIEVLIAILILALGLLGLGAVIPVVVREQRVASEATRAVIAANNAKAYLLARPDLNRLVGDATGSRGGGSPGGSTTPMGFGVWLEDQGWSTSHLWEFRSLDGYDSSGVLRMREGGRETRIPVAERLWPDPSSGAEPQLVWDIAGRRVRTGDPSQPEAERTIEIALFVRRIDPAIRVAPGQTRLQVLTDASLSSSQRRLPLGVDPSGRPLGDGTGVYSKPRILDGVQVQASRPNVLESDETGVPEEHWSVPGQRLVDNLGNIYRVVRRADADDPSRVVVDPPVAASDVNRLTQVVFTPQIPAAVEVFRITIPQGVDLDGDGIMDFAMPVKSPNGSGAGTSPWFGRVGQTP